jgi:adenine modification enzyme
VDKCKGFIYSEQQAIFGDREIIGFGAKSFFVREIDRDIANKMIVENHYSKKYYNASYIHLGVYMHGDLVGILQYGYAMNPASAGSVVKDTQLNQYLELNRMWLDDKAPRNSESKAISYSIKYIKKKYPDIKWIQSFADERCGCFGIVYQSANFEYYGEHTATFWTLDGEIYHNSLMTRNPKLSKAAAYLQANKERATPEKLRQFRYLYWIDRRWKVKVLLRQQKFPKHYLSECQKPDYAALNTGRFFIGTEKEQTYCDIARKRVEQAQAQQSLFG